MRGYKIFGPDYTCRGYKYSLDEWNVHTGELIACESGFHFCKEADECVDYYLCTPENTYAEVECDDEYIVENDKIVCKRLKIINTLSYEQFEKLITIEVDTPFKKCKYVAGKLQGKYQEWYQENKQLKIETAYVDNNIHGSYKRWLKDGQLENETNYENGVVHGMSKFWYPNGQLESETNYENGLLHGMSNSWYLNGGKKEECSYVNGKRDGRYTYFYDDGMWFISSRYKNGKLNGNYITWNPDGIKNKKVVYENGDKKVYENGDKNNNGMLPLCKYTLHFLVGAMIAEVFIKIIKK